MSATAEGADMQEVAVGKGATQVVKVIAFHPTTLVKDWLTLFIFLLWHWDVTWLTNSAGLGMTDGGGVAGDNWLKTVLRREEKGGGAMAG